MKNLVFVISLLVIGLLSAVLVPSLEFFSVSPDLFFCLVALISLYLKESEALVFSLIIGILKDSFGIAPAGINTVLFPAWSLVFAELSKRFSLDRTIFASLAVFVFMSAHNFITSLALVFLGRAMTFGMMIRVCILGSLYTALVFPFLFKFYRKVIGPAY